MKYIFRSLALLIFLLSITSLSLYAGKTKIRLLLKKGQKFEYLVSGTFKAENNSSDKPIEVDQKMELTIDQVVLDKLRNGNYLIQADYKRFTLEINSNDKIAKYDSNLSDNRPWFNRLLEGLTKISLKYEVSPLGVVSNLTGFEEFTKDKDRHDEVVNYIKEFGTDRIIVQMYNYIPKLKVEKGDQWIAEGVLAEMNNLKYDINYMLDEVTDENCKLDFNAKFKYASDKKLILGKKSIRVEETITQKGNIILDTKRNLPLLSTVNQKTDMLLYTKDTVTNNQDVSQMKMTSQTTTKLVK